MKRSALALLACPDCKGSLELAATTEEGGEVLEGALSCRSCSARYPVRRGVPRFVGDGSYAASFGLQWRLFRSVQLDSTSGERESERALEATTGWRAPDYAGRVVLDAGVGAGRFAEVAAAKGAEVFGIDLTEAVDAAYANLGSHPRVHLIQADVFALPFRDGSFDLAYSIGVLHHTPDARAAFGRVAAAVRPGGQLAVYLYDRYGLGHRSADLIRRMTTRLPLSLMLAVSAAAVVLYYPYRLPLLGRLFRLLLPISMHPRWRWRWLDTFDWYTPRYQWKFLYPEVYRWFRDCGFADMALFDGPLRMRGVKAAAAGRARRPERWDDAAATAERASVA